MDFALARDRLNAEAGGQAAVLGMKRDDEVIPVVLARPGVLSSDGLDQPPSELDARGS